MADRSEYLYPQSSYHGDARPETVQFNADLQAFSQRVSFICALGNNGKLTPREAYDQIQELWSYLEPSGNQLLSS